eukprot:2127360-Pyramimonas_sp.AAC.1
MALVILQLTTLIAIHFKFKFGQLLFTYICMASINGSRHLHANHTASLALLACMTIRHPAASSSSGGATSVVSATRQCNISQRNYRPCSVCAYSVSQEPHQVRSNMPHQSQQVHHDRHGSSGVNMYVPPGFQ